MKLLEFWLKEDQVRTLTEIVFIFADEELQIIVNKSLILDLRKVKAKKLAKR